MKTFRKERPRNGHLPESFLPEGEWTGAESQKEMTQNNVKLVCQGATSLKTVTSWKPCWQVGLNSFPEVEWAGAESERELTLGIFLRGGIGFFMKEWVTSQWNDADYEKNDFKTDKGNRKGKYKHLVWCNFEATFPLLIKIKVLFLFNLTYDGWGHHRRRSVISFVNKTP